LTSRLNISFSIRIPFQGVSDIPCLRRSTVDEQTLVGQTGKIRKNERTRGEFETLGPCLF
jgi:hypothetical protein